MTPFVIGIILILGGIAFAAVPLLRRRSGEETSDRGGASGGVAPAANHPAPRSGAARSAAPNAGALSSSVASALEELELDRAMGKLGERDYEQLRASILRDAEAATERPLVPAERRPGATLDEGAFSAPVVPADAAPVSGVDLEEAAERMVRALRVSVVACPDCGPRPEPAAPFCSNCGRALGACPSCGAEIAHAGARFCDRCGSALTT